MRSDVKCFWKAATIKRFSQIQWKKSFNLHVHSSWMNIHETSDVFHHSLDFLVIEFSLIIKISEKGKINLDLRSFAKNYEKFFFCCTLKYFNGNLFKESIKAFEGFCDVSRFKIFLRCFKVQNIFEMFQGSKSFCDVLKFKTFLQYFKVQNLFAMFKVQNVFAIFLSSIFWFKIQSFVKIFLLKFHFIFKSFSFNFITQYLISDPSLVISYDLLDFSVSRLT